jgi:anti-anti-sigma regulatory factor
MTALELRTTEGENATVIAVIGPLTAHTSSTLHARLHRLLTHTDCTVARLDLNCCTHLDTDGMLSLDVAHGWASRSGIDLWLVCVPPLLERLLRQHNFAHLLAPGPAPPPDNHPARTATDTGEPPARWPGPDAPATAFDSGPAPCPRSSAVSPGGSRSGAVPTDGSPAA